MNQRFSVESVDNGMVVLLPPLHVDICRDWAIVACGRYYSCHVSQSVAAAAAASLASLSVKSSPKQLATIKRLRAGAEQPVRGNRLHETEPSTRLITIRHGHADGVDRGSQKFVSIPICVSRAGKYRTSPHY